MMYIFNSQTNSNFKGYDSLIRFFNQAKDAFLEDVEIDFSSTTWIDANLLALLGAILSNIEGSLNNVKLIGMRYELQDILQRNSFLSHFGGYKTEDYNHTTIRYMKFKTTEEKLFKQYLDNELLSKQELPSMSNLLKKKISESIFEIFNNAVIHGNCKNIFSCGQYFPSKKKLDFTIVDIGTTIKSNIINYLHRELNNQSYLSWAVKEGNTTKSGNIPGGLGLSLIGDFMKKNSGGIQIISDNEYWEQCGDTVTERTFNVEFPGTIVNLEFNINDSNYYYLASEKVNIDEIF